MLHSPRMKSISIKYRVIPTGYANFNADSAWGFALIFLQPIEGAGFFFLGHTGFSTLDAAGAKGVNEVGLPQGGPGLSTGCAGSHLPGPLEKHTVCLVQ